MSHFEGKTIPEHLKEARKKGATATMELHGVEMPGYKLAAFDTAKEGAILFTLMWLLIDPIHLRHFILVGIGWTIWRVGRSAMLGWARLERLNRLIEEERWEIEHHREEERSELKELYRMKGLSGKLLDDVIAVLMADDNRLLSVMLEEELGVTLEIYEHPLKQSLGAGGGAIFSLTLFIASYLLAPTYGPLISGSFTLGIASYLAAKTEKNHTVSAFVWTLSIAGFGLGVAYFFGDLLS